MYQHDQQWYDSLHIITWPYWFIDLSFTCSSPQPVRRAESCLDLLHLDHMTQCHVSCAMSSFIITCVSLATSPSHLYHHGIYCLHTCICGLITCVSHINTISPPKLSLNYQNQTRTFPWCKRASPELIKYKPCFKKRTYLCTKMRCT
jgi:hypothetical protein